MNGAQKTIKGLAVALAVIIIVSMISAFIGVGTILSHVFRANDDENHRWSEEIISDEQDFSELKIKLNSTSLKLEEGEKFEVVADKDLVKFQRNGDRVEIKEKDFDWMNGWKDLGGEVKVKLPRRLTLRRTEIELGAGKMTADGLTTDELKLELGAGKTELNDLTVLRQAKINGGAGMLVVRNSKLKDLDLDMGVGKVELGVDLTGDSKINAGVGKLELDLAEKVESYCFKVDKGIGSIKLNDEELDGGTIRGEGENLVEIDGGVGAIEIRTED